MARRWPPGEARGWEVLLERPLLIAAVLALNITAAAGADDIADCFGFNLDVNQRSAACQRVLTKSKKVPFEVGRLPAGYAEWIFEAGCHVAQSQADWKATQRAADQGDASAQFTIGCMYEWSVGVREDEAEMVRWWRKAADRNLLAAQRHLRNYYYNRRATRDDWVQAYALTTEILRNEANAASDEPEAPADVLSYLTRQMTPAEIDRAKALAEARRRDQTGQ